MVLLPFWAQIPLYFYFFCETIRVEGHEKGKYKSAKQSVTVKGEKLHKLILSLEASEKIDLLPADNLVTLIEDENFSNNREEINQYLKNILKPYNLNEYSHIILGCTHFPIVKSNIEQILKEQNLSLKVIDGNEGIGRNLLKKIAEQNETENELNVHVLTTADNEAFKKRTKEILCDINYDYIKFC